MCVKWWALLSFPSVKDEFEMIFYELLDFTLSSLNNRFPKNVIDNLCKLEQFVIGQEK